MILARGWKVQFASTWVIVTRRPGDVDLATLPEVCQRTVVDWLARTVPVAPSVQSDRRCPSHSLETGLNIPCACVFCISEVKLLHPGRQSIGV